PNATSLGTRPTGIVATTLSKRGSIRVTVFANESATQSPPAPVAMLVGAALASKLATTRLAPGAIRDTWLKLPVAAQTGLASTATCPTTLSVRGSITPTESGGTARGFADPPRTTTATATAAATAASTAAARSARRRGNPRADSASAVFRGGKSLRRPS